MLAANGAWMEFLGEDGDTFFYSYAKDEIATDLAEDVELIQKPIEIENDFFNQATSGVSSKKVKGASSGGGGGAEGGGGSGGGVEEKASFDMADSTAQSSSTQTMSGALGEPSFAGGDETEVLEFTSWWNESAGGNNPVGECCITDGCYESLAFLHHGKVERNAQRLTVSSPNPRR